MDLAGIEGPQATPKELRHGFGCHDISFGLPESLVDRLMGHADGGGKSTRIYRCGQCRGTRAHSENVAEYAMKAQETLCFCLRAGALRDFSAKCMHCYDNIILRCRTALHSFEIHSQSGFPLA